MRKNAVSYEIIDLQEEIKLRIFVETQISPMITQVQHLDILWIRSKHSDGVTGPRVVVYPGCFTVFLLLADFLKGFEMRCINGFDSPEDAIKQLEEYRDKLGMKEMAGE